MVPLPLFPLAASTLTLALAPGGDPGLHLLQPPLLATDAADDRLAVADLDGDGLLDLVVSDDISLPTVSCLGQGDGSFVPTSFFPGGPVHPNLHLADLDGDDVPDLLRGLYLGVWEWRPGLGDGSFGAPHPFPGAAGISRVALVDLDGDGDLDALQTQALDTAGVLDGVYQLINDGLGGFVPSPVVVAADTAPVLLRVGDLDGDGSSDLVLVQGWQGQSLWVHLAEGPLGFGPGLHLIDVGEAYLRSGDLHLDDVDGDGDLDLLVYRHLENQLDLWVNPGDGQLTGPLPQPVPAQATDVILGHLDADGLSERVFSDSDGHELWVAPGGTTQLALLADGLQRPVVQAVVDVDGDGRQDLLVSDLITSRLHTLRNATYPSGSPFHAVVPGLAGAQEGTPLLLAQGAPVAGQTLSLDVAKAPPGTPTWWVLGLSELQAPFKAGVLVPALDLLVGPLPTDGSGKASLAATWPAGLTGFPIWTQAWLADASGPAGFTATVATRIDVP